MHLKSGCQRQALRNGSRPCSALAGQVAPLQGWIAQRRAEGVPFAILGDFNRVMDGQDELLEALQRTGPLQRATEGRANPCWRGRAFIDHILAGGAARGWMQPTSLRVLVYREEGLDWQQRLSDHCPVSVRFILPDG